jgi:uncharacterized protein YecT (DUF1311 family)
MTSRWPGLARFSLLAAVVLSAAASASAEALDCKNAMSTPDINACAWIDLKAVDSTLNQAYQRTLKRLGDRGTESAAATKKLIAAQRAWIKFRDADCDSVDEMWAGGTIHTVMHIGCLQHHAEQRIKDLDAYAEAH